MTLQELLEKAKSLMAMRDDCMPAMRELQRKFATEIDKFIQSTDEMALNKQVTGITSDSRLVKDGYVFVAISGTQVDGAKFIPTAVENGAVFCVADQQHAAANILGCFDPRFALAILARCFYPKQPPVVIGITGTNGKTSIAQYCQQLLNMMDVDDLDENLNGFKEIKGGSLGTLGAFAPGYDYALRHTTPDPVEIHQILDAMANIGTTHLAMEVSSHGLSQYRTHAVDFTATGFTNITQDHLDYHDGFDDYFDQKKRLFTEVAPMHSTRVLNMVPAQSQDIVNDLVWLKVPEFHIDTVNISNEDRQEIFRVQKTEPTPSGIKIWGVARDDDKHIDFHFEVPLIGDFQVENLLVAAGLIASVDFKVESILAKLPNLRGAPGRMELAGIKQCNDGQAGVYVDYAHTPDAMDKALQAIRPHAQAGGQNGRLICVFGAGGDRDNAKRPLMGESAAKYADLAILTDDNPRTEDPVIIRQQIMQGFLDMGAPLAVEMIEIPDRDKAIAHAIEQLQAGDVLLIGGKGHEQGQIISDGEGGTVTLPFDDVQVAQKYLSQFEKGE